MNLSNIIENMRNSGTREEQDRRDAARYRYLKQCSTLEDLYDMLGQGPSSWDWVVRLESGKSKGEVPPTDTPSFDATVDANMYRDGYIDLPRASVGSSDLGHRGPRVLTDPPYVTVKEMRANERASETEIVEHRVPVGTHCCQLAEDTKDEEHDIDCEK